MKEYLNSIRYCCVYFRLLKDKKSNHFSLLLFRYLFFQLKKQNISYDDLIMLEYINMKHINDYIDAKQIQIIDPAHLRIIHKNDETITEQFLLSYIVNHFSFKNEYCVL